MHFAVLNSLTRTDMPFMASMHEPTRRHPIISAHPMGVGFPALEAHNFFLKIWIFGETAIAIIEFILEIEREYAKHLL
jgi:hypothetical protein